MNNVLGIVFSNMHEQMISELTGNRCMGSIPVGGRYRLIDFALSSMTNAGIKQVGVITKSNYQSLMDHLGNGSEWDLSRKHGGLVILPPFGRAESGMYRGRIEALAGIMEYIQSSRAEYIICADCDLLANIDLADFAANHYRTGADISLICKSANISEERARNFTVLLTNGPAHRVTEMLINPQVSGVHNVYLNIMMLSRQLLEHLINECYSRNLSNFEKDFLHASVADCKVCAYPFNGYVSRFDSMKTYYSASMALLDGAVRDALFPRERPVYTKIRDEAPVRYGLNAHVKNSLLADGCIVEGNVENSILFRGVRVGKGAKVCNSIVMQGTSIGAESVLDYVITDKNVTIQDSRNIMGFTTYPVYIAKGSVV